MNGEGLVIETGTINFPVNNQEIEEPKIQVLEEIQIETIKVSEIDSKNKGTRFARLKRVLRKRSSASIL